MANEAVMVEQGGNYEITEFIVADGTAIDKGTICKITDPRTAAASDGANFFAGIAASDKTLSDGSTTLGLYTKGVFEIKCNSGVGIAAGQAVKLSGANVIAASTDPSSAFGTALETASVGEVIQVKLL